MAEFIGDEAAIALQKSLRDRAAKISQQPYLSNGGRVLNILDVDEYGWDNMCADAKRDGVVGLTLVDRDSTLERLSAEFETTATFPCWRAFTGLPTDVLPACNDVLANAALPAGWKISSYAHPDEETIDQSQQLNSVTGVAPAPAYYLRGAYLPSTLTVVRSEDGEMAACASATMRYHPQGPQANWLFAGGVSVNPSFRRKGLGSLVNAALLRDSHAAFGWTTVLEQARAENAASVGMITRCGLRQPSGKVTIAVILGSGFQTL